MGSTEHSGDKISSFEIISRSSLDLVLQNIPGTQEPFAIGYPGKVLATLSVAERELVQGSGGGVVGCHHRRARYQYNAEFVGHTQTKS